MNQGAPSTMYGETLEAKCFVAVSFSQCKLGIKKNVFVNF
jgi:hypothetical protein